MHGLPPRLLVSSAYAVLELAHTPVYHRAIYSQCHPGDSERPRKTPCRGRGEPMSAAVRIFNVHSLKIIKQQTCLLSLYKGVNENFTESKTKQYANDGKNQLIPFRPDWAEASGELLERWWSPMLPWTSWTPPSLTQCTTLMQSAWTAPWGCYGSSGLRLCSQYGPKSTKLPEKAWASYFIPCRYTSNAVLYKVKCACLFWILKQV